MRREGTRRLVAALAPLLVVAGLVSCGDDGGAVADPTTTSSAPAAETDQTAATAATFRTDGAEIVGPDGEPFVPRGVNLLGPQSFWDVPTAGLSDAVTAWGLNSVRLNICLMGGCDDADGAVHPVNDDLEALVDEFTGAGLVVILSMHQLEPGTLPDDAEFARVSRFWTEAAQRYGDNPLVWFNLLNEPGEGSPVSERWLLVHERLIDAVRVEAPNVIVVDGTQYGQEAGIDSSGPVTEETSAILRYGPQLAERASDVVFSVHVYEQWAPPGSEAANSVERLRTFVQEVRSLGLPLMIGETGGPAQSPDGAHAQATRAAYEVAGTEGVGLLAWHGQARDDYSLVVADDGDDETSLADLGEHPLSWQGELLRQLARGEEQP
jgi:aryl-phospho-beta-D-glucosidase BglC (GH1 family)